MENKTIYLVKLDMFDGEEHNTFCECYDTQEKAQQQFDCFVEDYKDFWECFDTIKRNGTYLVAYDEGEYCLANITINIDKKEIL